MRIRYSLEMYNTRFRRFVDVEMNGHTVILEDFSK